MIRKFRLALVAAGLVLLLGAEWLLPAASKTTSRQPSPIQSAPNQVITDTDIVAWGDTVLARPIFSRDRRPARLIDAAVDESLPRLSAIIVIGGTRSAIFAGASKPVLLTEGGQIGVYRIKTVAADSVALIGPDGLVTVRPQFITSAPMAQAAQ